MIFARDESEDDYMFTVTWYDNYRNSFACFSLLSCSSWYVVECKEVQKVKTKISISNIS